MLDTARNFIPVLKIKEVKAGLHEGKIQNLLPCQLLDSMSYSKLNVFHWHVTDSQVKLVDINTLRNISNARFGFLNTWRVTLWNFQTFLGSVSMELMERTKCTLQLRSEQYRSNDKDKDKCRYKDKDKWMTKTKADTKTKQKNQGYSLLRVNCHHHLRCKS